MRSVRKRRAARFAACSSGAAILEFALVLPILILLVGGTYEVGRGILTLMAMEGAVRAGARYLARVPDPECRPGCSPGAAHAVALTLDGIAESTGLARDGIAVAPDPDPVPGTVAMVATLDLGTRMPALFGTRPSWTLRVLHREQRVAE